MGWDYQTYLTQPDWFLAQIAEVFAADNEEAERQAHRSAQGNNHG